MCFIVFAYQVHPSYRLIAAANRDEYFERPTAPLAFWEEAPQVLAGRDLKEGGTWMGITREGKFAAITNFRDPGAFMAGAPSRGKLVSDFLTGSEKAASYVERISRHGQKFNGFNLICGDRKDLFVYSNRGKIEKLEARNLWPEQSPSGYALAESPPRQEGFIGSHEDKRPGFGKSSF